MTLQHSNEQSIELKLVELTTNIITSLAANCEIPLTEIDGLITRTHSALATAMMYEPSVKPMMGANDERDEHDDDNDSDTAQQQPEEPEELIPAVPIRASVKPDYIVCLEDGKKLKVLKRYLRTHHNLTPAQYIERWGLPKDYPMVAPNYSELRKKLAEDMGLGQGRDGRGRRINAPKKVAQQASKAAGQAKQSTGSKKEGTLTLPKRSGRRAA